MFSLNAAAKRKTTALGGGRAALTAGATTKGLSGTAPAQTTATKPPPRAFHANDSDSDDDDDRVPVKAAVISTRSAPLPTFADDDGDDDDMHGAVAMSDDDDAKATSGARHAQQQQQQQPQQPPPKRYGLQLSSAQLKETAEVQRAALREEATIFDYDAVYDHIKAAEQQQVLTREGISQRKEVAYMCGVRGARTRAYCVRPYSLCMRTTTRAYFSCSRLRNMVPPVPLREQYDAAGRRAYETKRAHQGAAHAT